MSRHEELDKIDWGFKNQDTQILASNIHPYPAKFIPQIPQKLIDILYSNQGKILDPMCGSGNTNMVSSKEGIENYGFDLNPVSTMISKSKCYSYGSNFREFIESFTKNIENLQDQEIPGFPDKNKWFNKSVLQKLSNIYREIEKVDDKKRRIFLKVTFSSILKKVSKSNDYRYICDNMYPGRETNSLEPDLTDYNVYKIFKDKCFENLEMVTSYNVKEEGKIYNKDSRNMGKEIEGEIELTISSPPYVNAVDYARLHRLSFYWFDYPLRETRDDEIGSRSKRGRKNAVQDYFDEMKSIYKNVYDNTMSGGYMCLVVGNSQKNKEKIDTINKTVAICENLGFTTVNRMPRKITKQSTGNKSITTEEILVFKK